MIITENKYVEQTKALTTIQITLNRAELKGFIHNLIEGLSETSAFNIAITIDTFMGLSIKELDTPGEVGGAA